MHSVSDKCSEKQKAFSCAVSCFQSADGSDKLFYLPYAQTEVSAVSFACNFRQKKCFRQNRQFCTLILLDNADFITKFEENTSIF